MKIPKRAIISLITALTLLTGCSQIVSDYASDGEELVLDENTDPEEYTVKMFNKVLELIEEKDSQAIFDLFSKYDRDVYDLMPEIENVVEFFDSEVTKVDRVRTLYEAVLDGYSASTYITTKNKTEYWLKIRVITTGEKESRLGLEEIFLQNLTITDEYLAERREWLEKRKNGSDEEAPQEPTDGIVSVNYSWKPWARKEIEE